MRGGMLGTLLDRKGTATPVAPRPVSPPWRALAAALQAAGAGAGGGRIEFYVEEGAFAYPLGSARCGWGCIGSGVARGRVLLMRIDAAGHASMLAEAEIRTSFTRPWRNADEFVAAATVLVEQGSLGRRGTPVVLPALREPRVRVLPALRWALTGFLPSLWETLLWKVGLASRLQWNIGLLRGALPTAGVFPWDGVRWLDAPRDAIAADPFIVQRGDEHWLFYEHMAFAHGRGEIHVARLDPVAGELRNARVALSAAHHLSFPNVFEHDGQWYMLPEQAQSGATTLYRAVEFPWHWERHGDLLPGFAGIDPVLLHHGDCWWLFVTRDGGPCMDNNLHLFRADRLEGPYTPHPGNPVRTGLHGSRMAGPIHTDAQGRLIRPAQDGREGYGHGLVLFEIVSIDTQSYVERELCTWAPSPRGGYAHGFHAIHACGDVVVIDGQRRLRA